MPHHPILYQINVSLGGVPKRPIPMAWVSVHGLVGDEQRNHIVHGGPERAVCVFSLECIRALQAEGHEITPGATGENLTIAGLQWDALRPGCHLHIGETVHLELTAYCEPCQKNARWFRNRDYRRISQRVHPGWSRLYARVLREGYVRQGDCVRLFMPGSDSHVIC